MIHSFKYFFNKYPKEFVLYSFLFLIENFTEFLGISLFAPLVQFINGAEKGEGTLFNLLNIFFSFMNITLSLNNVLIFICLSFLTKAFFVVTLRYLVARLSGRYVRETTSLFFNKLKNIDMLFFQSIDRAETTNIISEHLKKSSTLIIWAMTIASSTVALVGYCILAVTISAHLSGITAISSIIFAILIKFFLFNSKRIGEDYVLFSKKFTKKILEALEHFSFVKCHGLEDKLIARIKASINEVSNNWRWYQFFSSSLSVVFQPLVAIVLSAVIYFAVKLNISAGEMIVFLVAIQRILPTYIGIQNLKNNIILTHPSLVSTLDLIQGLNDHSEKLPCERKEAIFRKDIVFTNVIFSFDEKIIFKNLNLSLQQGKVYALVGPSGVGKSTLLSLIQGLYRPQEGNIFIDGHPLTSLDQHKWRSLFSLVSQEAFLLNESVKNNICYFLPYEKSRVEVALKKAAAKKFVDKLENRLDYILSDSSSNLSGGQKQRISLARMFYSDREILILDEPTGSLDKSAEREVINAISRHKNTNKTIILITHNEQLFDCADFILRINNCQVEKEENFN